MTGLVGGPLLVGGLGPGPPLNPALMIDIKCRACGDVQDYTRFEIHSFHYIHGCSNDDQKE